MQSSGGQLPCCVARLRARSTAAHVEGWQVVCRHVGHLLQQLVRLLAKHGGLRAVPAPRAQTQATAAGGEQEQLGGAIESRNPPEQGSVAWRSLQIIATRLETPNETNLQHAQQASAGMLAQPFRVVWTCLVVIEFLSVASKLPDRFPGERQSSERGLPLVSARHRPPGGHGLLEERVGGGREGGRSRKGPGKEGLGKSGSLQGPMVA